MRFSVTDTIGFDQISLYFMSMTLRLKKRNIIATAYNMAALIHAMATRGSLACPVLKLSLSSCERD